MIQKFVFCLSLILTFAVTSVLADVFWIDRYGNISWEEERARLDNFAFQILHDPGYIGYIYINAGREACKDEAQKRAVRAKKYLVEVRGVPSDKVVWKDLGYKDEAEVIFYIFLRSKPIPYNPEYEPAKEGQIIKDCKVKTRKQKKRGKNNAAPNKSLDVRAKQRLSKCLKNAYL
jgi:hypothetical protein